MSNDTELWMQEFNYSDDYYFDAFDELHHHRQARYAIGSLFIIIIIVSMASNILGLAYFVRARMWLRHEGYLYLVAIFASNIGILMFDSTTYCISHWNFRLHPADSSEFMCRVWHFLMSIFFSSGWLSVGLLLDVYLREHLVHRRRCGCPNFAAKYCTLFASKIIVGVIFGAVFLLGLPYLGLARIISSPHENHCIPYSMAYHIMLLVESFLMWVLPLLFFVPVLILMTLCLSREGDSFGFSQIEDRALNNEQFRTLTAALASMSFFSQFMVGTYFVIIDLVAEIILDFSSIIQACFALSIGFQPIFCFIFLTEMRSEALQKLRGYRFCRRFIRDRSRDAQSVRLQELEENPENPDSAAG